LLALFCFAFALQQASSLQEKKKYDGHQVLRFFVQDEEEAKTLNLLIDENFLDVWSRRLIFGQPFDVNVPPHLLSNMKDLGINFEVFIEDLQKAIEQEEANQAQALADSKTPTDDSFYLAYQQWDQIQSFVQTLVANYSSIAQYIEIGQSVQGRPIFGVVIGGPPSPSKPGFAFNGCQHAREWISPMTVTYMLNQILAQYESNPDFSAFSWSIFPVINPDGYIYTQTDRMWRKNRRPNRLCYGVDTNRNWNNHWSQGGSSTNPCSEIYCGPSPFSEPEETALANYLGNATNVQAFIDFHSYSQLWVTPWAWTAQKPVDYNTQIAGANAAVEALTAMYGTQYQTGDVYSTIYQSSGSSLDYTYGNLGIKYSYVVELRDQGQYGFLLPPNQILPSGRETFAGLTAMAQYVKSQL